MGVERIEATMVIPIVAEGQRLLLQEAQRLLGEAGVTFDTGYDLEKNERDWNLDFSLEGAWLERYTEE